MRAPSQLGKEKIAIFSSIVSINSAILASSNHGMVFYSGTLELEPHDARQHHITRLQPTTHTRSEVESWQLCACVRAWHSRNVVVNVVGYMSEQVEETGMGCFESSQLAISNLPWHCLSNHHWCIANLFHSHIWMKTENLLTVLEMNPEMYTFCCIGKEKQQTN